MRLEHFRDLWRFGPDALWQRLWAYGRVAPIAFEEKDMRLFECGTLVPGCDWHTRANDDAEVVRRAVEHMRNAHGETVIRESMVDHIKERIRAEANAA
jgi:predicted small metal-binding protein